MNTYATLDELKTKLHITASTDDADLLACLNSAARTVDGPHGAKRGFFIEKATKYFSIPSLATLQIPDLLAVTSVATDQDGDGVHEDAWESTDYRLTPRNGSVKQQFGIADTSEKTWSGYEDGLEIAGTWGYGDGESASPWTETAIAGTVADATGTSLTLSEADTIEAGHTLLIGAEQLYVSAVVTTTATVVRGVNGSTAAAHDAATISTAKYPPEAKMACLWLACDMWRAFERAGLKSFRAGDYSETMEKSDAKMQMLSNILARVRR